METFDSGSRKANKEHKCNYCNGIIEKGEEYYYSVHKMDEVYTWKSHKRCSELVKLLDMEYDMEGLSGESFNEYIAEYIHDLDYHVKAKFVYGLMKDSNNG